MTSSLADQLRRYSKPQTSNLERGKVRASLLFDPKEAAGIRKEVFYEIGTRGLEELISRDEIFDQFTKTLFSLESKSFERSVETTSSNVKLDKHIRKFLLLLSPYVLLHCTYKALEWLIYRYSIHQYNRDDFLMLVLPYHDTKIFQKVIALMKFEEVNDRWTFLESIKKGGVPLTNQYLLNHASSDPNFIHFTSDFILDIIKVHEKPNSLAVAFNFYNQVFIGAIEYSKGTPEAIITQMLPALLKGLNSHILDFRAASYIITARLITKCTLSDVILDKFMQKVSKNDGIDLKNEAVLLYCILYQGQPQYKALPDEAIAEIITQETFAKTLQELNNGGTFIYPFLESLMKKVIEKGVVDDASNYRIFLNDLLDQLNIQEESIADVLNVILDAVPRKLKNDEIKEWITEMVAKLETQYPTQFDQQVYKILTLPENENRKNRLQKILKGVKKLQKKFDIFTKLYDSNALIRIEAIKFILQHYDELRDEEKDILKTSLEHRLKDECFDVVKEALGIIDHTKILQGTELNRLLCELLLKCYREKECRAKLSTKVLRLLCVEANSNCFDILTVVFPILLPKSNEEIVIAKSVIQTSWFECCPLFSKYNKNADLNVIGDFPNELFKCLKYPENSKTMIDILSKIDDSVIENLHPIQKYSAALLFSKILGEKNASEHILPFLDILEKIFNINDPKSLKTDCSILECIKLAKRNIFPLSGYLECIFNMVAYIGKVELEKLDFTSSNFLSHFLYKAASIFYNDSEVHQLYFDKFNDSLFGTDESTIDFMLHLVLYKECYGSISQNAILNVLIRKLRKKSCSISCFFNLKEKYVPYLLILLTSLDEEIRKKAFAIGKIVTKFPADEKKTYLSLIEYLMEHQEEIVLDSKQLPIMVSNAQSLQGEVFNDITDSLVGFCCNPDTPLYLVAGISEVLSAVNNISVLEKITDLAMSISNNRTGLFNEYESQIIHFCVQRYDETIAENLKSEHNAFKFLISFLKIDKECLNINGDLISPSLLIMKQLNESFFSSLDEEIKTELLNSIIEVSVTPPNPNILLESNKIFKHINLDVELVIPQLIEMEKIQSENMSNKKRKRTSITAIPTIDILDTLEWKKGVRVLELIQDKKKMMNVKSLICHLFTILKKCLNFEEQAAVEYPKQLILSLILLCCQKLENVKLSENSFDMELVVQCIRASSNPQTHHHALQVLAHCASLFPTQVLHHIMAIFTFMGSSVLRHDDNYSFQLISSIIDSVIPILVKDGTVETIISVLQVFVDVLLDVPEHRRLKLYTQLLQKIDVEMHLYLFLQLVFVSHVLHSLEESGARKQFEEHSTIRRLNIAIEMVVQFTPSIGFNACKKLIHNLKKLPIEICDLQRNTIEFDITHLTDKQFRNFKYTILIFINNLVSSREFISKLAVLSEEDHENLEPYYKDIIVGILSYIQKTHPILDKNKNSHYWKAIQNLNLEILDCMNALLTPEMFLLVIKGLMSHDLSSIRKRSLDLLNAKLQSSLFLDECIHKDLHSVVDSLVNLIKKLNTDINEDEMIVIQKALLCLKLVVKAVGSEDPEKYVEMLAFITKLIKIDKAQDHVLSSLILCLVELCVTLRARAIEYLPTFMPVLLKLLTREKKNESPTLLCVSLLTAIQKIFEVLPLFISPYLKKVLCELSQLNGKWIESENDPKLCHVVQKLKIIKFKLAQNIPMRLLIPAIQECYSDTIEKNRIDSIAPLMGILAQNLRNMPSTDISPHLPELKQFFMTSLEFRNLELCDMERVEVVENHIIEALTTLVIKLSDSAFKPFFNKIFIWAEESEEKNDRIITFYNVTCALGNQLKSLFVLFANVFIKNAAKILDACNRQKSPSLYFEDQVKNTLLLEKVLQTLKLVFEHSTRKFITKERFETLMQPIVDNLENDLNGMVDLERRNVELLTPCIVNFAVATADDSLWKQLNYQILLKMRNSNYKIRLISLNCLTEMVKKLGEDFLPLLPETIPFLSELLEDDHEVVQDNCKKSIQELEEVLGENLSKYF